MPDEADAQARGSLPRRDAEPPGGDSKPLGSSAFLAVQFFKTLHFRQNFKRPLFFSAFHRVSAVDLGLLFLVAALPGFATLRLCGSMFCSAFRLIDSGTGPAVGGVSFKVELHPIKARRTRLATVCAGGRTAGCWWWEGSRICWSCCR